MLHEYTIKNNIVLFINGPLSNWYGAFKKQENGQFEMEVLVPVKSEMWSKSTVGKVIKFNCSEQAMMYEKAVLFNDFETAQQILDAKSPADQKALGRAVKGYDENEWAKVRFHKVCKILKSKFEQNEDLRKFLCEDLDRYIIAEAAHYDPVWGIGLRETDERAWNVATWQGQNLLGRCLMKVRDTLNGY